MSACNGLRSGQIAIALAQERGKIMGIVLVYLPEIRPGLPKHIKTHIAQNEILRERSPFPRAGYIYIESNKLSVEVTLVAVLAPKK